jgi:uncharacterized membrane protein YidH (DUF202 family)
LPYNEHDIGVKMNNKIIGIMLIVFGVALIVWGYDMYNSPSSQIASSITGNVPIQAFVGMIGGAINVIVGISKLK